MDIEPRKQGRQARAKATASDIVEAAARILEGERMDTLNTHRIAERAGVSIGSLYQYFPNKEAILASLVRRERSNLLADVQRIAAGAAGTAAKIDALIDAGLEHQFARPRLALQLEYIEQTLDIGPEAQELATRLADTITDIVRAHAPHADRNAARDIVAICHAIINTAAITGETDTKGLRQRLQRAVYGYLGESNCGYRKAD